jgi:hypothetical protein
LPCSSRKVTRYLLADRESESKRKQKKGGREKRESDPLEEGERARKRERERERERERVQGVEFRFRAQGSCVFVCVRACVRACVRVQEALRVVFQDEEKPNVFLFTTADDTGLEPFKAGVQSVRGKMVTARFQAEDFEEAFKHFGMDKFVKDGSLPKVHLILFCIFWHGYDCQGPVPI